ncbi:MAG: NUDIX hydrolase [Deltaproteobacteria bacterium]|nr:NUDIX hydrolase [Deltaproteobacteria bacterium]
MKPAVAVAGIAFDDGGRVLLARRGRPPAQGLWSVPGGKVELGESLAEACQREMREETGLEVEVREQVTIVERIVRDAGGAITHHYVIVELLVDVVAGDLQAGSDAAEVGFFELDAVASMTVTDGLEPVLRQAQSVRDGRTDSI